MANATRSTASPTRNDSFQQAFDWSTAFAESLMLAQRVPFEALILWQRSFRRERQGTVEPVGVPWAGGAPIDA